MEGALRTRKWQAQDGQDRYTTEIVASEMQMLDSRGGNSEYTDSSTSANSTQQSSNIESIQEGATAVEGASPNDAVNFDDDIPF